MDKRLALILIAIFFLAFMAGRYSAPMKVEIQHKVDSIKDQIISELKRQLSYQALQTDSITSTVTTPDGTVKTRTRIRTKSISIESVISQTEDKKHDVLSDQTRTVTHNRQGVVVGPMVTFTTHDLAHPLVGGVFDANILGPLHLLGNIAVGASIGVGVGIGGGFEF
jgi:hypothetical protein